MLVDSDELWSEGLRLERKKGWKGYLERYLRWVLGVEGRTPRYLIREELQREKLTIIAERRACKFKERLLGGRGNELTRP